MAEHLIGREQEISELRRCLNSGKAEFVIVYGRRRVGKTFLIRQFFNGKFDFHYVGAHRYSQKEQLENFSKAVAEYGNLRVLPQLRNWRDAFDSLRGILESKPRNKRKVIFIDEMPWIGSHRTDFVKALENFWNGWAANRDDIFFISCGSSTSWMVDKIVMNQGGLHNRVTSQIYLRPFNLHETEEYLLSRHCEWDRLQILQCYMVMGGIPYYLEKLHPSHSLAQNIDRLFFDKNAPLRTEFDELYNALFNNADKYISVVRALAESREGLTRNEIAAKSGITGGWLTKILSNLERCDFTVSYARFGSKSSNIVHRLADFYTLFYFKYIENNRSHDPQFWTHTLQSPAVSNWHGHTFELIGLTHLAQIKRSLQISGILTSASVWRSRNPEHPYQIDLLIDRADRIVNLCEMKFSTDRYIIDKDYEMRLRDRRAWFVAETRTRKSPVITFVTTYGVMPNRHAGIVQNEVTMDDLFD